MKQYITVEQYKELSIDARNMLRAWWLSTIEDEHTVVHVCALGVTKQQPFYEYKYMLKKYQNPIVPLLSIGELIQFLDERSYDYHHDWWNITRMPDKSSWYLAGTHTPHYVGKKNELIDALWEAVKAMLSMG